VKNNNSVEHFNRHMIVTARNNELKPDCKNEITISQLCQRVVIRAVNTKYIALCINRILSLSNHQTYRTEGNR